MNPPTPQIKVLQVFGERMNRGGSETWAMHVLRHIDRERFRIDFMVESDEPGDFDDEIRSLGSEIFVCSDHHNPLTYASNFRRILRENGPYDVVHSQLHHIAGYALLLARMSKIPIRIAHSHGDFTAFDHERGRGWRAYTRLMRRWIKNHATAGLAASEGAASDLFGRGWRDDPKWRILYCGIDLKPFSKPLDKASVRREFRLPEDAFVVGHVGRFYDYKNHAFLVRIASEIAQKNPKFRLFLVGEGPTFPDIKQQVREAGLEDVVVFTGLRADIPRLMLGAMDVFVLPSLYEGLPLVGLEAQAAGLPLVLSDTVSSEMDANPERIRRLSLIKSPSAWADEILDAWRTATPGEGEALRSLAGSDFDIDSSVMELQRIYAP